MTVPNFSEKPILEGATSRSTHTMGSMQKKEALLLLKEILTNQAANPNWISIEKTGSDKYELTIKGEYQVETINKIAQAKGLTITESNGTLTIR